MTFFYDLNKRLAALASKQDQQLTESKAAVEESKFSKLEKEISKNPKVKNPAAVAATVGREKYGQKAMTAKAVAGKKKANEEELDEAGYSAKAGRAGKDLGKPGKAFSKIAKSAGERYGSKEAGERVAGAVLNKLRGKTEGVEESSLDGHSTKYGVVVVGHNDGKPVKMFDKESDAKTYADKGIRVGGGLKQGSVRTIVSPKKKTAEGNAFTGALAKTPKGGKFKVGNKEFTDNSDLEEGFADMDAWLASREKEKGTGRFDKKKISTGTVYTRKPETFDDPETDPEATGGAPKRRGRPKGKDKGPERVTAKSYKYKAGRPQKTAEDLDSDGVMMTRPSNMSSEGIEHGEQGEYNDEAGMAKDSLHTIVRSAKELERALRDNENLPEWVQEKIGQIKGMMSSVTDYILSTHEQDADQEGITLEKAPPGAKAERMVKHIKKSLSKDGKLSDKDKAIAYATTWKAKKAGKVEEAGKPDFLDLDKDGDKKEPMKKAANDKKEEKVDETTVAGSVATAPAGKKSSGGYNFGGGVYESINSKVESMITEGMNVSVNMTTGEDGNPTKNITVSADGDDAEALATLLKMAGLGSQSAGCGCGNTPCSCEQVDENSPDWPTDTDTLDAEPNLRTYSGGLNGPKSTGQTTIPVVASQERRLHSESVELERNLFNTWKNYKG